MVSFLSPFESATATTVPRPNTLCLTFLPTVMSSETPEVLLSDKVLALFVPKPRAPFDEYPLL